MYSNIIYLNKTNSNRISPRVAVSFQKMIFVLDIIGELWYNDKAAKTGA